MTEPLPPLATTIIGSYAQPGWYISALDATGRGELGEAEPGHETVRNRAALSYT
jgi:hypothetical protein